MSLVPNQLFVALRDHLDAELSLHRRLLGLAEAKGSEIIACNMAAFSQLLQQEQAPLAEMGRLRQAREQLNRQLAAGLGLKNEPVRMTALVAQAPEMLKGDLRTRQGELKRLLERLREINERNMILIRQSLNFVRSLMHTLVGERVNPGHPYDRRGHQGSVLPGNGRLVNMRG
jgi:flagellar biosynthesis/type III secretory pathway chaperone